MPTDRAAPVVYRLTADKLRIRWHRMGVRCSENDGAFMVLGRINRMAFFSHGINTKGPVHHSLARSFSLFSHILGD
jgi:hypothetical protein